MMKTMCWITLMPLIAVPVRLTDCGLPIALSLMVTEPVMVPATVGEKLTLTMQLFPGLTVPLQVLLTPNPELTVMLEILSTDVPVLMSETFWAGLVVPTTCWPNVRLVGDSLTPGPVAAARGTSSSTPTSKATTYPQNFTDVWAGR